MKLKTVFIILNLISLQFSIIVAQEKKFELDYNISGWYKHQNMKYEGVTKTDFLNNNIKLGYRLKPFLSIGLSTNYYFRKYDNKSAQIILPDGYFFEYYTDKQMELGIGPYAKFTIGKNYNLSMVLEYNYSYGLDRYNIREEKSLKDYSGQYNYFTHYFATQIELGKKLFDKLSVNLFVREQLTFVYTLLPINPNITSSPSFSTLPGFGLNYNFN